MATTTAFKNQLLDSATITHIQLHSAATAGSTVSHYSFWNNSTYLGSKAFTVAETYSNNGTARVTSAKLTLSDL
jgi:hypothetical protein